MRAGELKRPPLLPRNLAMRSCAEGHQVGFFDEISEQKRKSCRQFEERQMVTGVTRMSHFKALTASAG
ncbi:hypothetical protein IWQ55_004176 [Labrenzia sp. EL_208]|nr:hypothetical protein [Labrenzia sp. EL_132]MBG6230952.1 hypothetical protein [Labrenzia sp. EL_208]